MWYKILPEEQLRLKQALELGKYGALETWEELFTYQRGTVGVRPQQTIEIAKWAARKNSGKTVLLPLKDNPKEVRDSIMDQKWTLKNNSDLEQVDTTIADAESVFLG